MKIFGVEISAGDAPVEPPPGAPTDIAPGFRVVEFASRPALDAMGRMLGVAAEDAWNPQTICECVCVAAKLVLMPTVEAAGGQGRHDALLRHAAAHSWKWTHPPGQPRKWLRPDGRPVE